MSVTRPVCWIGRCCCRRVPAGCWGLSLELPGGGTIVSSNAEVAELADDQIRFSPGLGERTEVWLRTDRRVGGLNVRTEGDLAVVAGPAGADLVVTFD